MGEHNPNEEPEAAHLRDVLRGILHLMEEDDYRDPHAQISTRKYHPEIYRRIKKALDRPRTNGAALDAAERTIGDLQDELVTLRFRMAKASHVVKALNDIAEICESEKWDDPQDVVRDVERLKVELTRSSQMDAGRRRHREKKDRSMILRMAGNIAAGIYVDTGRNVEDMVNTDVVAEVALILAQALVDQYDNKPSP